MKRWDDILFNCSFRLLQLLLSFSIYGYKQINSEINETFIKTPLSVTPEDMEVIQRRLSDIQRIEKQNFKAKQNKKFKRDHLNQQSSVLEEDQILNMLKENWAVEPSANAVTVYDDSNVNVKLPSYINGKEIQSNAYLLAYGRKDSSLESGFLRGKIYLQQPDVDILKGTEWINDQVTDNAEKEIALLGPAFSTTDFSFMKTVR
ncbi:unnamed protein product [Mytilus coruscus]|uniref:Uncharacterized protein n=1 Tax=Mytilus coruscus TaxID=42192 RepID=A0A6J8AWK8_MYTCO|nr:unnamed protein product [Mytilus coruscus]